jgi:ceramide glucosyltransferase
MILLTLIFAAVGIAALVHFGGIALLFWRSRGATGQKPYGRPPVTVLRPACGIENYVEETLASAFALDYQDYEIVSCVADERDPVIPLIRRLMNEHPHVRSRLLVGDDRISINPKLNNLVKGWHAAANDWIVMTDSNVLMPPDYLDRVLERWQPDTGLVCSPPVGIRPEGVGADLECAFLNTYQARWQLIADALGTAFAQGKTMFWRRDYLDEGGSIEALAAEPAEDAASTKLIRAAGRKVRLVIHPFPQPLGRRAVSDVWRRQMRWARLRRSSFPLVYAPEAVSGGFFPLLGAAVLVAMGALPIGWLVGLAIAWYAAEMALARRYDWPMSTRILALMILRDLLLFPLWVVGWTGNTFVWRGNAMDIKNEETPLRRLVERWSTSRVVRSAVALATGKRAVANLERGNGAPPGG